MSLRFNLSIFGFVPALLSLVLIAAQTPATKEKVYSPANHSGVIYGTVSFSGTPPPSKLIDMSADEACVQVNRRPAFKKLSVKNQKVANVLVYVESSDSLDDYSFETPQMPVTLEHRRCQFQPHMFALQVGQPFAVVNSDDTQHNTHPSPRHNKQWNQSQAIGGDPIVKAFDRAEVGIRIRCNQHPWEQAYVSVFKHPFFAVTDADGNFRIDSLPPGKYQLMTWHEFLGEKKVDLQITVGESREAVFSFAESDMTP